MKPKSVRWLRWLKWTGLFALCWITVIPTLQAIWVRQKISSALRSATAVRLEEFVPNYATRKHRIISSVELSGKQRDDIVSALPILPDIGVAGVITLCYKPHHKAVILQADGNELVLEVCFGCDELRLGEGGIMMTPFLWKSPLRKLFTSHSVPIREQREYSKLTASTTEAELSSSPK
jgi:hypothetical protein